MMSYNTSKLTPTSEEDDCDVLESTASVDSPEGELLTVGKDETRAVSIIRIVLMLLLMAAALAVSMTAYCLTRQGEQEDFEGSFESHATKIIESFASEAAQKRTAIVQLSRQLTSHARFTNATWPFVTLPDFEMNARLTLDLAEVIGIFILPLVRKEQLQEWKEYTVAHQAWYWEGMAIQEMFHGVNATQSGVDFYDEPEGLRINGEVVQFGEGGPNDDLTHNITDGPYFPVWQYTPQIPIPVIGADFRTLPEAKPELDAFLRSNSRRSLAGRGFEFEVGSPGGIFLDLLLERWQGGGSDNKYEGGPLSYYYIPIYEDFERDSPLVGVSMAFIYWQTYFEDLLPKTASGIHVVLDNTCNQSFTFGVSGNNASFLGNGDMHDTRYDYLKAWADFGVFLQQNLKDVEDGGGCYYRIRVYPTQEMEDDYLTMRPLTICLAILGVFVFTTLVFILYDRFVERRQRLVMKTAQQTSDVVTSLFPETVRARLYEKKDISNKGRESNVHAGGFLASTIRRENDNSTRSDPLRGASPIADEYMNCTVFFADLAGFTKWSSTRTPSEVFLLLETLYGAFDKIAKRLGVFKIETIGDCYVAVTGLPLPQDDHAIIMCKFAASCVFKMNQVVNREDILLSLGDDTANLELRVGMHSGPVTAGVLRGEKARFQLFGDTVNTAARMESNGQKGRIQGSQVTADLLVAAGKDQWLTAREDLVEAKGKGKMQTYWVDILSDPSGRHIVLNSSAVSSSVAESLNLPDSDMMVPVPPPQVENLHPTGMGVPSERGYDNELEV